LIQAGTAPEEKAFLGGLQPSQILPETKRAGMKSGPGVNYPCLTTAAGIYITAPTGIHSIASAGIHIIATTAFHVAVLFLLLYFFVLFLHNVTSAVSAMLKTPIYQEKKEFILSSFTVPCREERLFCLLI